MSVTQKQQRAWDVEDNMWDWLRNQKREQKEQQKIKNQKSHVSEASFSEARALR